MQDIAHIETASGDKVLVLRRLVTRKRDGAGYAVLKLRKTGNEGRYLEDESNYLKDDPKMLAALLEGKSISL